MCGKSGRAEGHSTFEPHHLLLRDGTGQSSGFGSDAFVEPPIGREGAKDLEEFVKKANYVLHGLKFADRPSPKTMFEWLWHQIKGLPILRGTTDKVRESSQGSPERSFEWIWTQMAEELRERRHDMNYENVVKGSRGSPPHQVALPATGGEQ